MARSTKQVLDDYLEAVRQLDEEAQSPLFADDAVLLTSWGPAVGKEAIAATRAAFFAANPHFWYETIDTWIHGDLVVYTWKGGSDAATFPIGVQSFLIRDGLIQRHTFWATLEPK
jgi:ketosteroid isomerase-like protein